MPELCYACRGVIVCFINLFLDFFSPKVQTQLDSYEQLFLAEFRKRLSSNFCHFQRMSNPHFLSLLQAYSNWVQFFSGRLVSLIVTLWWCTGACYKRHITEEQIYSKCYKRTSIFQILPKSSRFFIIVMHIWHTSLISTTANTLFLVFLSMFHH